MPVALKLNVAGNLKCNIKRFVKHPMLTGVIIWGFTHLVVNGGLDSSMIFFHSWFIRSLVFCFHQEKRMFQRHMHLKRDVLVVGIGCILYAILVHIHQYFTVVQLLWMIPTKISLALNITKTHQTSCQGSLLVHIKKTGMWRLTPTNYSQSDLLFFKKTLSLK